MVSKRSRVATEVVARTFDAGALGTGGVMGNTCIAEVIMTQYVIKKGLQEFGATGDDVAQKELRQIHDREVLRPRLPAAWTDTNARTP